VADAATGSSSGLLGLIATRSADAEEVLRQYCVPLSLLAHANLRVALAGEGLGASEGSRNVAFRVRAGGTPDVPDGSTLLTVPDSSPGSTAIEGYSPAFARPPDDIAGNTQRREDLSPFGHRLLL
jgi:hypothetical protein